MLYLFSYLPLIVLFICPCGPKLPSGLIFLVQYSFASSHSCRLLANILHFSMLEFQQYNYIHIVSYNCFYIEERRKNKYLYDLSWLLKYLYQCSLFFVIVSFCSRPFWIWMNMWVSNQWQVVLLLLFCLVSRTNTEKEQNMSPQNMLLWHKDSSRPNFKKQTKEKLWKQ